MANNIIHKGKVEVFNPLTSLHTVGQELKDAFKAKGVDITAMKIANLATKERLTRKQMEKAKVLLGLDDFFVEVLEKSQADYALKKERCKIAYNQAKQAYRKLKPVLPLLRNEFNDGYDRLDDILDYFGVDSEEEIFEHVKATGVHVDEINLAAWLRRGELDFAKQKDEMPAYDKQGLMDWIEGRSWKERLEQVSYYKDIPKLLNQFGVCVVLIPYLQKTIYGAVKWIEGHPVIMVSDRDQDLATCWFTLFHEFGHVILHENELAIDGMIDGRESKGKINKRESEANKFASSYLFNGDDLRKHIFELKRNDDYENQDEIATLYNVERLFIGYWMKKAQYYPSQHHHIPISFFRAI